MSPKGTYSFDVAPAEIYEPQDRDEGLFGEPDDSPGPPDSFTAPAKILKVEWETAPVTGTGRNQLPVIVQITIPATDFAGLDITRPITITQEVATDE